MGFVRNSAAVLTGGLALLFLKTAWTHIHTHDAPDISRHVIADLVFATILSCCAYMLYRNAQEHYRRLVEKQQQKSEDRTLPTMD